MDANVFLVRCDEERYAQTVESPVDLSEYDAPEELAGEDSVRLWAVGEGSRSESSFEKMEAGDLVLFYADGEYVGTARVDTTFRDDDDWVGENVYGGASFPLVFTVTAFESVSVPRVAVNHIFGYSENYTPGELLRVAPSNVTRNPAAIKRAIERFSEKHATA